MIKVFVGSKNEWSHVENQLHSLIMSCDTRVLKILQCDWSEACSAITQKCNTIVVAMGIT